MELSLGLATASKKVGDINPVNPDLKDSHLITELSEIHYVIIAK